MAEFIPLHQLGLNVAVLPPLSRGLHLKAPPLHASRLVELWATSDDCVPLAESFRFLDAEAVEGAVMHAGMKMADEGFEFGDSSYWAFPDFEVILPEVHEISWLWMADGLLQVEAKKSLRAKQHRRVLPAELTDLTPNWQASRLLRGGVDVFVDVRVRLPSSVPVPEKWRPHPSREAIATAMGQIAEGYPPSARPSEREIWEALKGRLGAGMTRELTREALKAHAPHLRGRPGYRSRK